MKEAGCFLRGRSVKRLRITDGGVDTNLEGQRTLQVLSVGHFSRLNAYVLSFASLRYLEAETAFVSTTLISGTQAGL